MSGVAHGPSCAAASASDRSRADLRTLDGTHLGSGNSATRCAPVAVCSSRMEARDLLSKYFASLTTAGHKLWSMYVIFPCIRRHTRILSQLLAMRVARKISLPSGWIHQFPRIGVLATALANLAMCPLALSKTIP